MPKRRYLRLDEQQRNELLAMQRTHPKAYLRERARVLLRIAAGESPHAVACDGPMGRREPDAVYDWLDRYEAEGVAGLTIRAGRGRKPAFSPSPLHSRGGPTGIAAGDPAHA